MQGRHSAFQQQQQQAAQQQGEDPSLAAELRDLRDLHKQHRSSRRRAGSSSMNEEAPTRPAQQRWKPNKEQLEILEAYYQRQTPPSQDRIREIAAAISIHGVVDESKVYYWFQNRRSREKRKRRRLLQSSAAAGAASAPGAAASGGCGGGSSSSSPPPPLPPPLLDIDVADAQQISQYQALLRQHLVAPPLVGGAATSMSAWSGAMAMAAMHPHPPPPPPPPHSDTTCSSYENEVAAAALSAGHVFDSDAELEASTAPARIMLNGMYQGAVVGPVDVPQTFGEGAILIDPLGCIVPTSDQGVTLEPLQPGATYNLILPLVVPPSTSHHQVSSSMEFPREESFAGLEDPELWDFSSWN